MTTSQRTPIIQWARDLMKTPDQVVILDTETTGLKSYSEICEIALVSGNGDVLLNTRVKPHNPIPPDASRIHGITTEMVRDALPWSLIAHRVLPCVNGRDVVIYNAAYDQRMMYQSGSLSSPNELIHWADAARWHCAMLQYADYVGDWDDYHKNNRWHRLETACRQCGIPDPENAPAHSALGDCLRTLALVKYLARQ